MAITLKSVQGDTEKTQPKPVRDLESELANAARFVRQHVIASIYRATSGHPGGSLSCADLLATLFGAEMNVWPNAIRDPARDRFVLSKGHAAPALYAIGAYHGFCGKQQSLALRKLNRPDQGPPHIGDLPWFEPSTFAPSQGYLVARGLSMGLK